MFVITGATGHIGGGIARKLLADGKKVLAIGRDREKLSRLGDAGAETAEGGLEDTVFLARNLSGAEAAFFLLPTDVRAEDLAASQDRIGGAIAKAIAESGVRYVVALSSMGADLPKGNGPIAGLHRQEKRLNDLQGVNVLHLRPAYFMENQLNNIGMIKNMGILGSPLKADLPFAQIATRDIAAHAAGRLAGKDFSGKVVQELLGPRELTMQESAVILGKAIGKPELSYVQFPYEDALQAMVGMGMSPSAAESFVEMNRGFNEGILGKASRNAANTTPTTLETFAKEEFAPAFQA